MRSVLDEYDVAELLHAGFSTIREAYRTVQALLEDPPTAFTVHRSGDARKRLLRVDSAAEDEAIKTLRGKLAGYDLVILGEENLANFESVDFTAPKYAGKLVVLLDMIDGTDLLERGLSNWCSAMVFYEPQNRRIVASLVGFPGESIYFATHDKPGAFKIPFDRGTLGQRVLLDELSGVTCLEGASVAFYGQSVSSLLAVFKCAPLVAKLEAMQAEERRQRQERREGEMDARLYTLAGNPMMVRMIDGHHKIDAVFEISGQAPHDVVPGAYIAMRAGAFLWDLTTGETMGVPELNALMERPASRKQRVRYVVSCTEALGRELLEVLRATAE